MDPELLELINRLNGVEGTDPLTDEELADLRTRVAEVLAGIDHANPTDDDLRAAAEGANVIRVVDGQIAERATAAETRAAELAATLEGIDLTPPSAEVDPEADPEATPAATAEGEPAPAEGEPTAPVAEVTPEPAPEVQPEPVAAAATPPVRATVPSITSLAYRTPRNNRPVPTATTGARRPTLVASGEIPGLPAGQAVDIEEWARAVARKWDAVRNDQAAASVFNLGSIRVEYPEERTLGMDSAQNEERLNAIYAEQQVLESLAASGGICGPTPADYNITTIAAADRPVKQGVGAMGAPRGGVRFILPHTLAQVTGDAPVSIWTQATDANPGGSTKPHATFTCQGVQEAFVDAIPSIVQFGNFQARYFPEQIDQYMQTVDAVQARVAEATLLQQITAGSTAVFGGVTLIGSTPEYLSTIDRAAAAYRYRHRMGEDAPLVWMYPEWLEDNFRSDLARELPGNSGSGGERLAVADAQIDQFFRVRNLIPITTLDSPTGAAVNQGWGVQGAGPLLPWPTKAVSWMFHPGAWTVLDGGELNLGMVRDTTMNNTNNFQMFSEIFEKAVFRGHESLAITTTICDSGMRAGTVDTSSLCIAGS